MISLQRGLISLQPTIFRQVLSLSRMSLHSSTPIQSRFIPAIHLDNVEDVEDYQLGGLHPISLEDRFSNGRYKILHKLGFGVSSTIWLARDQGGTKPGRLVAIKALRAEASRPDNPELTILKILQAVRPPVHGIRPVYDHFFVEGANGSHLFVVYPFVGPNILGMVASPPRVEGSKRLRASLARKVVKQLVYTVDSMHRAGVVHGDITTQNILFCLKPHVLEWTDEEVYVTLGKPKTQKVKTEDGTPLPPCAPAKVVDSVDNTPLTFPSVLEECVVLGDFGQSYAVNSKPADYEPGTLINYFPPEARFEGRAGFEGDVWMLACAIFEIRSGFGLFSSFFGSDMQVLKETVAMLGRLPDPWWEQFEKRSKWFTENGEPLSLEVQESAGIMLTVEKTTIRGKLRSIGTRDDPPTADDGPLFEKTGAMLSEEEVELLGDLLEKMLRYCPEERIGLREVIEHPWLAM